MARCPEPCGKTRYANQHTAQLACIRAAMRDQPRTWYWSRACRSWHLTCRSTSGKGGRRGQWIAGFTPSN
jgi:hypothetical protein